MSPGRSAGLCQGGEVYTGRVMLESEERRRVDMRLRWPLRNGGGFMAVKEERVGK